ncbi:hypothetical protein NPIL_31261 [Nephila pilipes]|uniref:Uncharacterized protein n=1 Tax=Nephila pilipes TaxID=299642 RepID=A0A8X6NMG8_NEPPI|nr:hypothetical protein NPIL_31261 [Nephila pilipes]
MSFLSRARKVDLITLAEELELTVRPNAKISDLLRLITNDKNYDDDFTKDCLEVITNERKEEEQRRDEQRKDEHEKREWEYELKKLELESKATLSDGNVPLTVPKLNLMKLMPRYDVENDISKFCDQTDVNQTLVTRSNTFTKKLEIIVEIQGVKINALFETGSELSLISYESYIKIGSPKLSFNNVSFAGINQECLSPLGFFYSDIKFDKCCIATEIYVIKKLCCDIIIDLDVINKLNITINENGIEIAGKRNTFHASYATINFNRVPTHKTSPNNIKHITSVFRLAPCVGSEPNANNEVNVQPVVTIGPNAVHTSGKTADVEEIEYFF